MFGITLGGLTAGIFLVFAFLFVFDFVYHGLLLRGTYLSLPNLWRPEQEKQPLLWMLGQLIFSVGFCGLFARRVGTVRTMPSAGSNSVTGLEYGLWVALLMAVTALYNFVTLPFTGEILAYQMLGALVEYSLAGLIVGRAYQTRAEAQ